jgi:hypothetical protein
VVNITGSCTKVVDPEKIRAILEKKEVVKQKPKSKKKLGKNKNIKPYKF